MHPAARAIAELGWSTTWVIDPTHDEIDFIRRLTTRRGEISLQGNIKQLKINRLIPKYVTHVRAGVDTGVFTLTHQGWKLSRLIGRKLRCPVARHSDIRGSAARL